MRQWVRRFVRTLRRRQGGQSAILMAIGMAVIIGVAAISVDAGNLYVVHVHVENAADAAALAGATELPAHPGAAVATAQDYAQKNDYTLPASQVTISPDDTKITVTINTTVDNYFARYFGIDTTNVGATSTATTGLVTQWNPTSNSNPVTYNGTTYCPGGLMPWGVLASDMPTNDQILTDTTWPLKVNAQSDTTGNFYALAMGYNPWLVSSDSGAKKYEENIAKGSPGTYNIGETIYTQTGNMVGPTKTGFDELLSNASACLQQNNATEIIVVVPVIQVTTLNGKSAVEIVGFAAYAVNSNSYVPQGTIDGYFLAAAILNGETRYIPDEASYDLYVAPYLTTTSP